MQWSRLEPWPRVTARRPASSHGKADSGAPSGARDATGGGVTAWGSAAADLGFEVEIELAAGWVGLPPVSSGSFRPWEGGSERGWGWSGGSRWIGRFLGGSCLFCRWLLGARPAASMEAAADAVEEVGWWPLRFAPQIFPDLLFVLFVYLFLFVYFAYLLSVIRVIYTHCGVLVLSRIRCFFPRKVFVSSMWSKLGFEPPFLRDYMLLGIWIFPIWSSDTLQEIMGCKRIITVADGFAPQSLVGDPILVVYSLCVFCIFNGVVCLFYGTSLFGDLYVLLNEPFSAVMDFVQFYD